MTKRSRIQGRWISPTTRRRGASRPISKRGKNFRTAQQPALALGRRRRIPERGSRKNRGRSGLEATPRQTIVRATRIPFGGHGFQIHQDNTARKCTTITNSLLLPYPRPTHRTSTDSHTQANSIIKDNVTTNNAHSTRAIHLISLAMGASCRPPTAPCRITGMYYTTVHTTHLPKRLMTIRVKALIKDLPVNIRLNIVNTSSKCRPRSLSMDSNDPNRIREEVMLRAI
mmetsp:Transcript_15696/g.38704  ORF Transcript_15696/g.38704 Transcript_15696/m.38704 type:complete len:228 (+) Transcript_15696:809-1492(+)